MRNSAWQAPGGQKQREVFVHSVDMALGRNVHIKRKTD